MLEKIVTPGLWKMRNGQLARVIGGFFRQIGYALHDPKQICYWYIDGYYLYKNESDYDLMEKMEC